jgi:hypothetical protein
MIVAKHSAVIPGRREAANPESITTAAEDGFRVPAFGRPRNDSVKLQASA